MRCSSLSLKKGIFTFTFVGSGLFILITIAAMLVYPGGSFMDPGTQGYSFFNNFFSELGFLHTKSGAGNTPSAVLFTSALTIAGSGLVLFFLAFPGFFKETKKTRLLSALGSIAGVASGLFFMGIAWSPGDIALDRHVFFVIWAFRLFPVSVIFYAAAVFSSKSYPKVYGWVFVVFSMLLVGYILILEAGPNPRASVPGQVIQVTGQKMIVYASIVSIMIQAAGALRQSVRKT